MSNALFLIGLMTIAPTAITLLIVVVRDRLRGEHRRRSPIREKGMRYPGWRLQAEVEKGTDQTMELLVTLLFFPVISLSSFGVTRFLVGDTPLAFYLGVIVGIVGCTILSWKLLRATDQLRRNRRGLAGELYVAQQLTPLLRKGFQVFSNVPGDGFDIDHVVVTPAGIFTIETKYRRKAKDVDEQIDYDGRSLRVGGYDDRKTIEQAKRQTSWLARYLHKKLGVQTPLPGHRDVSGVVDRARPGGKRDLGRQSEADCIPNRNRTAPEPQPRSGQSD